MSEDIIQTELALERAEDELTRALKRIAALEAELEKHHYWTRRRDGKQCAFCKEIRFGQFVNQDESAEKVLGGG